MSTASALHICASLLRADPTTQGRAQSEDWPASPCATSRARPLMRGAREEEGAPTREMHRCRAAAGTRARGQDAEHRARCAGTAARAWRSSTQRTRLGPRHRGSSPACCQRGSGHSSVHRTQSCMCRLPVVVRGQAGTARRACVRDGSREREGRKYSRKREPSCWAREEGEDKRNSSVLCARKRRGQ